MKKERYLVAVHHNSGANTIFEFPSKNTQKAFIKDLKKLPDCTYSYTTDKYAQSRYMPSKRASK